MIEYNTLIVLSGGGVLGAAGGVIGGFAVLRRRALLGDAVAHAALPGLCLAFLLLGERNLPAMLVGALFSGLVGIGLIAFLGRWTRIKEDAAIGVVLSVFFGAGVVLSRWIQNNPRLGGKAGLDSYILGKTAGMILSDVFLIAGLAAACAVVVWLFFKEFRLVSFDAGFAQVQGWPASRLETVLMAFVAIAVVIGLPAVGVVLMAALLILPAAAARFWTDQLGAMLALSALFGAATGLLGTWISALLARMPTGPVITLVGAAIFVVSAVVAPRRGLLGRSWAAAKFRRNLDEERLLAACYEPPEESNPRPALPPRRMRAALARLRHRGELQTDGAASRLTASGHRRAADIVSRKRVWRLYLTEYPDLASLANPLAADLSAIPRDVLRRLIEQLSAAGEWPAESSLATGSRP